MAATISRLTGGMLGSPDVRSASALKPSRPRRSPSDREAEAGTELVGAVGHETELVVTGHEQLEDSGHRARVQDLRQVLGLDPARPLS